ncbi:P-loop containing nucleoside triphosphate hydrolase protein [Westerdykella ornata]|uniref:RNA helicase n=1 Tax=Westerdykella ornata TaxID=318751 RepID=A0A6A6JH25_WESOR|nr:P-loop containing nucleoside triphosphate hydrolase protein [Westerdykella ornata]KAF2275555.1 P-loop containing nucleoside triphosphate hydrolase protein [Westerdykella ornata]
MPTSTLRRSTLCPRCASAALPRPPRLLPHVQKAYRSLPQSPVKAKRLNLASCGHKHPPEREDDRAHRGPTDVRSWKPTLGRGDERGSIITFNPLTSSGWHKSAVSKAMAKVHREIGRPEFLESLELTPEAFDKEWDKFQKYMEAWLTRDTPEVRSLLHELRWGTRVLERRLYYLFYAQVFGGQFTRAELENQKEVADLRFPSEWYPATRAIKRKIHLHVGPTNSGKTYHALKRLEQAKTGIYLGPLRLLAHEVYTRMTAKGRPCMLVTGEEQRPPENGEEAEMWSCTVEMAPLNRPLDVAVIDEIQMISHVERGWAWTQAFLGLQASEIHLCGEARTVPLIKWLCGLVGEEVEVHEYERLTPLRCADHSLKGSLAKNLQKGDCVVSFSVLGIHALRKTIEKTTGRKCAIVYGSLPPETRAQQARLFNDPNNDYDFLVSSDAIGMGLNLSIKRVIFESTMKNNGNRLVPLTVSEIKQIAGRAGRYKTAHDAVADGEQSCAASSAAADSSGELVAVESNQNSRRFRPASGTVGYATTLEAYDFRYLHRCMNKEPEPIETAGIFPPTIVIERFSSYFPPGTPFSYILLRLHEICKLHPRFHLCSLKDQIKIADAIHPVQNLTVPDRVVLCAAPASLKDKLEENLVLAMARCIADGESGDLLDLPLPLEVLDQPPAPGRQYLYELERLHKMIVLYLWLSYRFPHIFQTRALANHTKQLVEDAIEKALSEFSFTDWKFKKLQRKRQKAMEEMERLAREGRGGTDEELPPFPVDADLEGELPQTMVDLLKDRAAFESGPATDDVDEYPTPEIEEDGSEDETTARVEVANSNDEPSKASEAHGDPADVDGEPHEGPKPDPTKTFKGASRPQDVSRELHI